MGADVLLAQAYAASGQPDKADETLQGTLFQSLALDLNRLSSMAMLYVGDPAKLAVIHQRALAIIDAFEFEKVFVNTAAIHASFAMAYMAGGDADHAVHDPWLLEIVADIFRALIGEQGIHGENDPFLLGDPLVEPHQAI